MDVRVGLWRKLSTEKLMLLNCGVGEDSWESLGLQGDSTHPSWRRSVLGVHWKDCCWSWNSNTLATPWEELTHWKRPWCWEGLGTGGEGDDKGWDGWMESPTRWAWVWVNSRSWWWTGRPGVLRFMGLQRVGHDWATELTELMILHSQQWTDHPDRKLTRKQKLKWCIGPVGPNQHLKGISPQNNGVHLLLKCNWNILQDRSHPGPQIKPWWILKHWNQLKHLFWSHTVGLGINYRKKQNTLRHKSQQDPLWPTSQNIRNKSKNKQMGPNEI